jgi:anthranilate phosphoribosyltransferase
VREYCNGQRTHYTLAPADFGIEPVPFEMLSAANAANCVDVARDMLTGNVFSEHYKLVIANAAFIYHKFVDPAVSLPDAYQTMEALLRSGAMGEQLSQYVTDQT